MNFRSPATDHIPAVRWQKPQ